MGRPPVTFVMDPGTWAGQVRRTESLRIYVNFERWNLERWNLERWAATGKRQAMRILHAYRDLLMKGGRPTEVRALLPPLAALGHEVHAVCLAAEEPVGADALAPGVTIHHVPDGIGSGADFGRILKQVAPDIVHFAGGTRIVSQSVWIRQTRRLGIPYIISTNGNVSAGAFQHRFGQKRSSPIQTLGKKAFHRFVDLPHLRAAAAVHALSDAEAALHAGMGVRRSFVVPWGVPPDWLGDPAVPARKTLAPPITFTYLGRLSIVHKGLDLVVDAFGKVAAAGLGDRFRVVLAGTTEGDSMDVLKRTVADLGVPGIAFPGATFGEAKDRLWAETHYFLHLCRYNGFALAAREALARGVPLLATRESDMGDWVERHDMGVVVPLDATGLSEAIIGLLNGEGGRYQAMTEHAMTFAKDTSWDAVAEAIVAEYARVLESRA